MEPNFNTLTKEAALAAAIDLAADSFGPEQLARRNLICDASAERPRLVGRLVDSAGGWLADFDDGRGAVPVTRPYVHTVAIRLYQMMLYGHPVFGSDEEMPDVYPTLAAQAAEVSRCKALIEMAGLTMRNP